MGGDGLPSTDELKAFGTQLGQYSPGQFKLELTKDGMDAWKAAMDAVVAALQQADSNVPRDKVNVGNVSEHYQSAVTTADHLNTSGDTVRGNIGASLTAARALQDFVQAAFDAIGETSGGGPPG